jgi:hypothetical protein
LGDIGVAAKVRRGADMITHLRCGTALQHRKIDWRRNNSISK